jgi:flagellar biosynthesis anti-sigma factor FlgM
MRITGSGVDSVDVPVANGRGATPGSEGSKANDAVVLSPAASHIAQTSAESAAARAARVAQLRNQVRSGTYRADREALANRLADDELARGGRR